MSRQRRIPTPAWEHHGGVDLSANRMKLYGIVAVILLTVAAVGVIGYGYLSDYLADQNRPGSTAVQVNDYRYSVRDYTKRAEMYIEQIGGTTTYSLILPTVSQQIIEEGILLESASEKNVTATEEEIRAQIATQLGITADDANFDARLQEELAKNGLTEKQYRDMSAGSVLSNKMIEVFKNELPATAESVHYRAIQVADQGTADDLKTQIDGGADFAELAAANSLDTSTKDKGGDAGWVPKGYLNTAIENLLFSLAVNETVTYPTSQGIVLYQVTETDDARAIDEDKKGTLAAQAYNKWLDEKKAAAKVKNDMDTSTGDGDKIKYVIDNAGLTLQ